MHICMKGGKNSYCMVSLETRKPGNAREKKKTKINSHKHISDCQWVTDVQSPWWELVILESDLLKIQMNCLGIFLSSLTLQARKNISAYSLNCSHLLYSLHCQLHRCQISLQWRSATVGINTLWQKHAHVHSAKSIVAGRTNPPHCPLHSFSISFFENHSARKGQQFSPALFPSSKDPYFFLPFIGNFMITAWCFRTDAAATK